MRVSFLLVSVFAFLPVASATPWQSAVSPDPNSPRPIDAVDTVFIEDMTWMEVRDAMKAGKDTVIVATGGIEQNGPYLVAGKHQVVLRATTEAIARKLGTALVAPIVGFVPEGNIDPPTEHMKYPSTVSVSEETYERLIAEMCACYRTHGFKHIVLIGDSGGNQTGLKNVAAELNAKWKDGKSRVHFIPEYYNYKEVKEWLESQGVKQTDEGIHDDFAITAMMMSVDPSSVRMKQRVAAKKFRINGIDLAPADKTIAWGRKIADFRADATVTAIRKAVAPQPNPDCAATNDDFPPKLSQFGWMTGSWQGKAFGGDYDEHWTPATGTIMMGVARTVRDGKTASVEVLRLEQTDSGIVLTAFLPKEGKFADGVPFKLAKFAEQEAVFENPDHDFPTRIIYRRPDDESLFARIEGMRNGKVAGVDSPLKRIKEAR